MRIYIEMLRSASTLRRTLEADGWRLEAAHGGGVRAAHPRLHDEADCRTRLLELGLLTSSACRIEFPPEVAERSDPAA